MGAWKTSLCLFLLCLGPSAAPRAGLAFTDPNAVPLETFAVCAGRLSAVMEHQWVTGGPEAEVTARQRDAMLSLVEAVLPPDQAPRAMAWRVEAKAAQAALLSRATFARDPVAARTADRLTSECVALIGQS